VVSQTLPRLRLDLDFMPSPVEDRPGLLLRDPYQFSDTTLIVPAALVQCVELFDGEHTDLDLRESLVRITGELNVGDLEQHLMGALDGAGFLENETFEQMREQRIQEFAEKPVREPTHAGSAYPEDAGELRLTLDNYMQGSAPSKSNGLVAIAAPHVSPFGGWESYRSAYGTLGNQYRDRTFIILGTSHYGQPEMFGLTRKRFVTPYGEATTDLAIVNELESKAPRAVRMEDYCHAVEHSIEFQVVFLQHMFGPGVRIVPILCGSYATSVYVTGQPEDDPKVGDFLDTLGEIAAREKDRLMFVLGIDMAHIGQRYGNQFAAVAEQDEMIGVAERDHARIERIQAGDSQGFWELVKQNHDDLKWCGSAPLYTFMKAVPNARGELLHYQQWNIDPHSVVSFAGMRFTG
jgi:AmmeMemoRadiSam system protein B